MKIIYFILTLFLANSCTLYKVKNINQSLQKKYYNKIIFIKNLDNYPSSKKVADFKIVDLKKEWQDIKPKLIDLCKKNYANSILVESFHLLGKEVSGKFYQIDAIQQNEYPEVVKKNSNEDRKVYFFRDELGSMLTSHFKTELTLKGKTEKLKDKSYRVLKIDENINNIDIAINGKEKELNLKKGNNYFWVSRQVSANLIGSAGLNISLGGQNIERIEDSEMCEIWISTLKRTISK